VDMAQVVGLQLPAEDRNLARISQTA
jgi:hypothetical protein